MEPTRRSLLDFFADFEAYASTEFLAYDDGLRSWSYSYGEVAGAARGFAAHLASHHAQPGDYILFWSENRPEWIAALWGCLLAGAIPVPVDYRASRAFVERVITVVKPRFALTGAEVEPQLTPALPIPVWKLADFDWNARSGVPQGFQAVRDTVAEVLFTSGATAEPKGVLITHGNILSNIVPVEREVKRYRGYGRPFFPIRFLNLLPLSHLFGQVMATMIPPMLPGSTLFLQRLHPEEIVRQVRRRRISVIVCVPKMLETLRDYVLREVPEAADVPAGPMKVWQRWWRYRRVHRLFGFKFWSFVVGAAPLDPELEAFWSKLGFVVIQGYGLTETAPIVSLNHPFHTKKGTVGKPIAGVEVKIEPDGEILVRGGNVTPGYYGQTESPDRLQDGWLRTGDMGSLDDSGRLTILGRKKEMIVTPDGLNIFPEDVERVLNGLPGVRESAVVGAVEGTRERVHGVVVADPAADLEQLMRSANSQLEEHQKIRGLSRWPGLELPRTDGTKKLKRREIRDWVAAGASTSKPVEDPGANLLARWTDGRKLDPGASLNDLGLSSLDRIELLMELEKRSGAPVSDAWLVGGRTVGELETLLREPSKAESSEPSDSGLSRWPMSFLARWVRAIGQALVLLPLTRIFAWIRTSGLENVRNLKGPALFASNHQSHFDTPVILAVLPLRRRFWMATAMAKEFFDAHFHPERHTLYERTVSSLQFWLVSLFFQAFPLPQREAGARQTLRHAGELLSAGFSVLIFPEGKRTDKGEIYPFQPGVAMLASRLRVPVIPVRLEGLEAVLHKSASMATPGLAKVSFGPPLWLQGEDYRAMAAELEEAVRKLGNSPEV